MSEKKKGPKRSIERIQAYFQEEQGLGRIGADVDPRVAASLLIGVCFHRSLLSSLFNEDPTGISDDELPGSVAACLWHGLAPSNEGTSA